MKWEYGINVLPRKQFEAQDALNCLGEDGWELVTFDLGSGTWIFKRPKPGIAEDLAVLSACCGTDCQCST